MADKTLVSFYGTSFPDIAEFKDGKKWLKWIDGQKKDSASVRRDKRLHYSRHRHFRVGNQWISTRDGRLFREPHADENDIRVVNNLIGPALDFRLSIVAEQRPGFRHEPLGSGVSSRESAEAQQAVAEFYFHSLRSWQLWLDAGYNAQTDGAAFIHVFVDPLAGPQVEDVEYVDPSDERFANLQAQGYEVDPDGLIALPKDGDEILPPNSAVKTLPLGDIAQRVILAHEVMFNAEAKSINGPNDRAKWCAIRRIRSVEEARIEANDKELEAETILSSEADVMDRPMTASGEYQRGLPPFPTKRSDQKEGIIEYLIFIAPNPNVEELKEGYWLRLIGSKLVESGETLPGGLIPLARFCDGSPDPQVLPRPVMSDWIGDQIAINALESLLMKHTRYFAGGRLLAQKNSLLEETYSSIVGSVVEYQGSKPDAVPPINAGSDAWRLLAQFIKNLEDKTGHNDLARGRVSESGSLQDVSGRALLGARELFERTFGPFVRSIATGGTEWARLIVAYAKFLFDTPRLIPIVDGRGDLAKQLSAEDMGEQPLVYVDPETMMPMPRAWRQQVLFESYKEGLISLQEYKTRAPYAEVRNVHMGQLDQWDRAQWINTVLQERWEELSAMMPEELYSGANTPILWQDDPSVHMNALSELILDERKPWALRQLVQARHNVYEALNLAKMNPMFPVPFEVVGAPIERQQMPAAPPVGAPSGAPPSGLMPGTPDVGTQLATPEMSGAQPATTAQLGEFGDVERQ